MKHQMIVKYVRNVIRHAKLVLALSKMTAPNVIFLLYKLNHHAIQDFFPAHSLIFFIIIFARKNVQTSIFQMKKTDLA